jgi:hypothetical protein
MGKLVNLSKLAILSQIAVASLSTVFIAVAFSKTSHYLRAKHVTIDYQLQQDVLCPTPPPLCLSSYTC